MTMHPVTRREDSTSISKLLNKYQTRVRLFPETYLFGFFFQYFSLVSLIQESVLLTFDRPNAVVIS